MLALPEALLEVRGFHVRYPKDRVALDDVSFSLPPRTLCAVVGPNGAGKSTLVKALCGSVVPSEGAVRVGGETLRPRHKRSHLIGLVPQSIGLYPFLTGRENLSVFAKIAGLPSAECDDRIAAALDTVQMSALADRRVENMSGGMQRRINVAAAILHRPPIIVFDEPTAGVDLPARDVIHGLATKLRDAGHTVLLVTHELDHAEMLCDHVLVLERGRLKGFAPPTHLLETHYGDRREVIVHFRGLPDTESLAALNAFRFAQREHPTVWSTMTDGSQTHLIREFLSALPGRDRTIREVAVRRPGLSALIHELEAG